MFVFFDASLIFGIFTPDYFGLPLFHLIHGAINFCDTHLGGIRSFKSPTKSVVPTKPHSCKSPHEIVTQLFCALNRLCYKSRTWGIFAFWADQTWNLSKILSTRPTLQVSLFEQHHPNLSSRMAARIPSGKVLGSLMTGTAIGYGVSKRKKLYLHRITVVVWLSLRQYRSNNVVFPKKPNMAKFSS